MARSYSKTALATMLAALVVAAACKSSTDRSPAEPRDESLADTPAAAQTEPAEPAEQPDDAWRARREAMVSLQIEERGVTDERVLAAMRAVPRHAFVPEPFADQAYADTALPIGHDQTISQPYVVAVMTELAEVSPGDKVLEIGTGSGYQAAVLAEIGARVYTIEIVERLGERAARAFEELGYDDIEARIGDGYAGWPDEAPFDAVIVTAAPPEIPQPLLDQLRVGGRMVIPVGEGTQKLLVVTKTEDGVTRREVLPVLFVPMTGEAQEE